MNDYPDLRHYGYQIDTELGRNREGGRITWKGVNLNDHQTVVIKQFCFAQFGSTWSGYQASQQEIQVLQQLNHPSIPKYIAHLETDSGFCLIQEYIPASKLSEYRQLTLAEVKKVALYLLSVLVYLQQQSPPILHRDLKPDNILLDEGLNVYLVDFGFASFGSREVFGSSVFKGTPGFIAPEQIIQPILASDIYSLGVTIVCLLTHKGINEILKNTSADTPYQLDLKLLLPELEAELFAWLGKMIEPQVSKRFANAADARDALIAIEDQINSTPDQKTQITQINSSPLDLITQPKIAIGGTSIFILSGVAAWGIKFAYSQTQPTLTNITIAIIAAIAIILTQLGAVAITQADEEAKTGAKILAIIIPAFLTIISGWLWGRGEAVIIACAIASAEVITVAYFWVQIPTKELISLKLKLGWVLSAIALGITFGIKLF